MGRFPTPGVECLNLAISSVTLKPGNCPQLDISSLNKLSSEKVTDVLLPIKGIGEWTINNFKIFALQDVNAWPSADLALQESVKILQNLIKRPNQIEMENLGKNWEPYRGAAALFLWHFYNKVKIKTKKK